MGPAADVGAASAKALATKQETQNKALQGEIACLDQQLCSARDACSTATLGISQLAEEVSTGGWDV